MMDASANEVGSAVVPVLRYRNLPAAIDWLCAAFGFERHRVVPGKDGAILFAQLTFGKAMIMVGAVRDSAFDNLLRQPDEIGGAETQVCYFFVADAHAHCARAEAAGAEIVFNIESEGNGGRSYSCRDPEGHVWNFGTYNPWQRQTARQLQPQRNRAILGGALKRSTVAVGLLVILVAALAAAGGVPSTVQQTFRDFTASASTTVPSEGDTTITLDQLFQERRAKEVAERANWQTREQLTDAQSAKEAAERVAKEAREQLSLALRGREAAEQASKEAWERLVRARSSREAAVRAAKEARHQLARERSARKAADGTQPTIQLPGVAILPR